MKVALTPEQRAAHRIRWYVKVGGELIPREATMRGAWPCEAKCSCGWESRTGGAVRSYVQRLVENHKVHVKHGLV
jgi:hypothetical protein